MSIETRTFFENFEKKNYLKLINKLAKAQTH